MSASGGIRSEWKTTANIITLIRIILIPLFVVVLIAPWPEWLWDPAISIRDAAYSDFIYINYAIKPWVAAIIYMALALTDGVDGYIARKRDEITTFGKFIDPIADKILVAAALLALIELGDLPSWIVLIIISREFIVSGLRMIAASEGVVVAARMSGKVKTALTMIAIVMFIVKRSSLLMGLGEGLYAAFYVLSWLVMLAALVMTLVSMFQYFGQIFDALDEIQESRTKETVDDDGSQKADTDGLLSAIYPAASSLLDEARDKGVHLATAESCTGGLIGASLTEVAGSSDVFEGGIISYAYAVKESELGVSHDSLAEHGAVSEQVVLEMVQGARDRLLQSFDDEHALAVAVTGVAGPGQSESKPAGTVWFGICGRGPAQAQCMHFKGSRQEVREQTVAHAIELMHSRL